MAKDPKPLEVLNAQARQAVDETKQAIDRMKQAVEETKGQALGAADTYFDFLNKTISSFPSGGREFGEKLKSFAEKNLAATHQFIQQLSQAKDFQDVLRIQTEFMQTQMQTFAEQATSLAEAFTKTAAIAFNPGKETRPLIGWLAALRSHYLAVPGMRHRRYHSMVGC